MTEFFSWYLIVTLLGWLTFPLAHALFPALADRGYTLSRAAGLLIWGYAFWLFASLGIAQNDLGGMLLALAFLVGLSLWAALSRRVEIVAFLRSNLTLLLVTETLFLAAFAFLAFLRSANPDLTGTERPMELAFINGILRSPTFPPQDPWLSGYAISYYYFGYVMTAMLARISGIAGSMAHNLMTALIFALGAVGSYGILYNLLSQSGNWKLGTENRRSVIANSLLAPLFLLLVSNFAALLEVLHRRGFFWTKNPVTDEYTSVFWKWLDMKELSMPPMTPFQWEPDRYLWWWRASRVVQDYDMLGNHREVIDEFPFFSFLLGDLHPHVLAIPFSLLAIAVAMNIFLNGFKGKISAGRVLPGLHLHVNYPGLLFSALVIGGLAFLNTWDILVGATLIVAAYILRRAREDGWRWDRIEDLLVLSLPLGLLSIGMYFPFYLGFSSQVGGILPNLMNPTRGAHFWVMWGTLLIPIFAYLIYVVRRNDSVEPNWKLGLYLGLGFPVVLFLFALLIAWVGSVIEQDYVLGFLASQGMSAGQFIGATSLRRLSYIGSLITLLALLIPSLAYLFPRQTLSSTPEDGSSADDHSLPADNDPSFSPHPSHFVFLLLTLGTVLVLAPDFVYLRDQFGYRINTVFKFYYQAWILWSLVAAFAAAYLFESLRGWKDILFRLLIALVVMSGLLYPILGSFTKTNSFKPYFGFTLDDFDRIIRDDPDEAAAIEFLRTVPNGVIAEAVGDGYSVYARISAYTGLQAVLGWPGHEAQWRGSYTLQGSRRDDIARLYSTARWEEAQTIIAQYDIRYIYIGNLERISLTVNEGKFIDHLRPIFQQGGVVIYEVP